jgi:hypothetical protein
VAEGISNIKKEEKKKKKKIMQTPMGKKKILYCSPPQAAYAMSCKLCEQHLGVVGGRDIVARGTLAP